MNVSECINIYERNHAATNVVDRPTFRYRSDVLHQHLGEKETNELTPDVMREYSRTRKRRNGEPLARGSLRQEFVLLRTVMNYCARHGYIPKADVPPIDIPPDSVARERWLTTSEINDLFKMARIMNTGTRLSRLQRFLWLAITTASREHAARSLKWSTQVDFETRTIRLNPPGRVQTNKFRPTVPISDQLLPVLKRMYDERINDYVMDYPGDIRGELAKCTRALGFLDVTPHILRHTAITQMLRNGTSVWTVSGISGLNLMTIERVYGHHCMHELTAGVNRIIPMSITDQEVPSKEDLLG